MVGDFSEDRTYLPQLRLLVEEVCTELCRFEHALTDGISPEAVRIDREYPLERPDAFADIRVAPAGLPAYVIEVKLGYGRVQLLQSLRRKFLEPGPRLAGTQRVVLVVDTRHYSDWPQLEVELADCVHPSLKLEVWDESRLLKLLNEKFHVNIPAITADNLLDVRQSIDRTHGFHAFGGKSLAEYDHDPLKAELLWHFGFWKIQALRNGGRSNPRDILPPGQYRGVAVVLADLCSFSSYVRDTPDSEVVRESLTSFYSKARYQILHNGGMLYQFVGDEVIGLFGVPEGSAGFPQAALDTARALVSIGNSVSHHWQRQIDRVQASGGVHVGLAMGDLQIVSLRPFSRTHVGAVGDCINVAARLMGLAGPSEIVVSNSFHQALDEADKSCFQEQEPVEAKNIGRIKAWKLSPG